MALNRITLPLDGIWQMAHCHVGTGRYNQRPAATMPYTVPGDVHTPLIEAGIIPEPLTDRNDAACRWLEGEEFWCERRFILSTEQLRRHMFLTFSGLDTTADIWLNGILVGRHDNAFVEVEYDVSRFVRNGENLLVVRIDPGLNAVKDNPLGDMALMWNNDLPQRAWMRKPQYVGGWDWTIWLITCGIWRSVTLTGFETAAIADVHACTITNDLHDGALAEVEINVGISGTAHAVECTIADADGLIVSAGQQNLYGNTCSIRTTISQAKLWWCNGMGEAYLYRVSVTLLDAQGNALDIAEGNLGLRSIAVREDTLECSESTPVSESGFTFVLNGVPVFCKGANIVPEDCLIARVSSEQERDSIRLAKEAHMNMLRVWGGGVYASEAFLDACDRAGIMVWHDFMFACGFYPDHDAGYMANVENEIVRAIRRLRRHVSVIGWSGNNECQEMYLSVRRSNPRMPFYGGSLYTDLLPRMVALHHPGAIYRESSPLGDPADPAGCTMGDQHIWHFTHRPNDPFYRDLWRFTDFPIKFLSEFGLIGAMNLESTKKCLSPEHLDPDDPIWLYHTNNSQNHQLLNMFVDQYFGDHHGLTLQQYILRSQAVQAEVTRHIYDEFRARKFVCSGLLFWTLGDSMGIHNWSLLDHWHQKKPVYNYLKRSMQPIALAIRGYDVQSFRGMADYTAYWADTPAPLTLWGMNDTREEQTVTLSWRLMRLTGEVLGNSEKSCTLPANTSVCLESVDVTGLIADPAQVILCAAISQDDEIISENRYFFAPFKEMLCRDAVPECITEQLDAGTYRLTLNSERFVWMLHIATPDGVTISDNDFDLLPCERRQVIVQTKFEDYTPTLHWLGEG